MQKTTSPPKITRHSMVLWTLWGLNVGSHPLRQLYMGSMIHILSRPSWGLWRTLVNRDPCLSISFSWIQPITVCAPYNLLQHTFWCNIQYSSGSLSILQGLIGSVTWLLANPMWVLFHMSSFLLIAALWTCLRLPHPCLLGSLHEYVGLVDI